MSLKQLEPVRVFDKWALGIYRSPTGTILVSGMNGEIVELDENLSELRRWQAHEGSVNCLRIIDGELWTGGGDACVKRWDFEHLRETEVYSGPKKPITSIMIDGTRLVAKSYERAVHLWPMGETAAKPRTIKKVASLLRMSPGRYWACPLIGTKAGDIGALSHFDLEDGVGEQVSSTIGALWSMQAVEGKGVLALGLDLKTFFIDPKTLETRPLDWHSKSGAPNWLNLSDGRSLCFGDGKIYVDGLVQDAPVKGLYCALELYEGRVAFSGADGQVWVFE